MNKYKTNNYKTNNYKMNTIVYNNKKYNTVVFPKNMKLFRIINSETNINDFYGIKINDKTLCLPYDYNVFFYQMPYVADTNNYLIGSPRVVYIYKLLYQIELLIIDDDNNPLINNNITSDVVHICSEIQHCNMFPGRNYDLCLKKEFIEAHPKINGMYYVSRKDSDRYYTNIRNFDGLIKENEHLLPNKKIDMPHLSLFPLNKRTTADTIFNIKNTTNDYKFKSCNNAIFELVKFFNHRPYKVDKYFGYLLRLQKKMKHYDNKISIFI